MNRTASFINYKKSRFSTRLPTGRLYTRAHFWIDEVEPGLQRVGFTKFATRMLGDLVETGMEVQVDDPVEVGGVIGWIECLKAASDLFCMAEGSFVRENPDLNDNPEWLTKDPYARGWLYEVRGTPEPDAVDAEGYAAFLDDVISKMLGETA
ncbi:MAG: glycine cleavage system protein H [Acidobacteriota bacterium]|nr:glycine cleavage system protein H [Acidobacteriota bacterium]